MLFRWIYVYHALKQCPLTTKVAFLSPFYSVFTRLYESAGRAIALPPASALALAAAASALTEVKVLRQSF